ncbi:hypothetical protein GGI43DRAFT_141504 [Trichoderma evansii]
MAILFDRAACLSNACQSLDIKFNAMPLNPKQRIVAAPPSLKHRQGSPQPLDLASSAMGAAPQRVDPGLSIALQGTAQVAVLERWRRNRCVLEEPLL